MVPGNFLAKKFGSLIFISYFCPRHLQVAQLVWTTEPKAFGSAFVTIYGKAFITLCFWLLETWKISNNVTLLSR